MAFSVQFVTTLSELGIMSANQQYIECIPLGML